MDRHLRLTVYYVALVAVVLAGFALVYNYGMATWEGRPQPMYRSIEVVVQTVTTVGYGGDAPWSSPQMNYFVAIMQVSGLMLIFAALPVIVVPLFEDVFRTTAPTSVSGLDDHVVICSYGPREAVLVDELTRREIEYVIVEADRDVATDLYVDGYTVIYGDPETAATLERAGLDRAAALIADVDDETNPSVLLTARAVNPDVRTISLVEDPDNADYHRFAGADHVVSPRELLGENLADKAIGAFSPEAIEGVEVSAAFEIAEYPLQSGSELVGKTIAESAIGERTGAVVIGAWDRGEFTSPPPPDLQFDARSILLAAGTETQLDRLKAMTLSERRHTRGRVVVVGMGIVGETVASALEEAGIEYTTVDLVARQGVDVVGDATDPDVLRDAGVEGAETVVLALSDDTAAVFTTFVVREMNPAVEVIARANELESVSKLYRAGADYVLSLSTVSGRMLASVVLDEAIVAPNTQIKLVWTTAPGAAGRSLEEADVRARTGCTVLAAERDGETLTDVDQSFVVEHGDDLLVAGTDANIDRFQAEFGPNE